MMLISMSYFLFAVGLQNEFIYNTSQRFSPESEYFQSWFGMYTVNDVNGVTYSLENGTFNPSSVIGLVTVDQTAWLANFAKTPFNILQVTPTGQPVVTATQINGQPAYKINANLISNIDVGVYNNPVPAVYPYTADPAFFHIPSSFWLGKVPFLNTSPTGYDTVLLECVAYAWHENNRLNVIYYNGISYLEKLNNGVVKSHKTLTSIGAELETMSHNVVLQ
jgi:hypothetical protein